MFIDNTGKSFETLLVSVDISFISERYVPNIERALNVLSKELGYDIAVKEFLDIIYVNLVSQYTMDVKQLYMNISTMDIARWAIEDMPGVAELGYVPEVVPITNEYIKEILTRIHQVFTFHKFPISCMFQLRQGHTGCLFINVKTNEVEQI